MAIKDPKVTVKQALELFNGVQAELAKALGVSRVLVSRWKKEKRYVPPIWAYRLAWNYSINGRPPIREIVEYYTKHFPRQR